MKTWQPSSGSRDPMTWNNLMR